MPIKTMIKRGLRRGLPIPFTQRRLRLPFHFGPEEAIGEVGTFKNLESLNIFGIVKQLNTAMIEAEKNWDGGTGTGWETKNTGYYRDEIIKLYSLIEESEGQPHKINSSIGPYTNRSELRRDYDFANAGTPPVPVHMELNLINSGDGAIPVQFHIPKDEHIYYRRGRSYRVAYFGARVGLYWNQLENDIEKICEDTRSRLLSTITNSDEVKNINDNIDEIKKKFKELKGKMQEALIGYEEPHRAALGGGGGTGGVLGKHDDLASKRNLLMPLKLVDTKVFYTHTYKVMKPLDEFGRLIKEDGNPSTDPDDDINTHIAHFKRPEEAGPGLDMHGWPLEVGDNSTPFDGGTHELGEVLIDKYEGRAVRVVPEHFTEDWELLDVAMWIYVSYDAYRDDLRDGRYHEDAISVMERIMTELRVRGHPQTMRNIEDGTHARITMNLNKLPPALATTSLRPADDPASVDMPIEPTHLNPAFDLRVREKTLHRGRKYYYDLQENTEQSTEPTITTRGAALYILHRIIEETKYWGGPVSQGKAGIMEVLEAIGQRTDGYDIGPNISFVVEDGEVKSWGQRLTNNPFRPSRV